MIPFKQVINGVTKYFDRNIYAGMNDWQEVLARSAVGIALGSEDRLKEALTGNGFIRTFCIIDENENVDIERVTAVIKEEVQKKGTLSIKIPVFGTFSFAPSDIDELLRTIREG